MKKLFISCPMTDRTDENIKASIEKMHKMAEIVFGCELEVIPTYIKEEAPADTNKNIWYLGKTLELMSYADYFIGILGWTIGFPECNLHKNVANDYGIKSYLVELDIFPDAVVINNQYREIERLRGKVSVAPL